MTGLLHHPLGHDPIGQFYNTLAMQSIGPEGAAKLARWRQKDPTSPTPVLASINSRLTMNISDLGLALGSSWIWHPESLAQGEIENARSELESVRGFASADPYWYVLRAIVMIAQRRSLSELDDLVDDGLSRHPSNFELVITAAAGHLSKWQGDADILEKWAQHILKISPTADGSSNYARIYSVALRAQYGAALFDIAKPDWQMLMTSVRDLISRHPNDAHLNDAAVLGCVGGNRRLTKEALQHANFTYSDVYWYDIGTEYHPYKICRAWAGQPAVEEKSETPTANP